MTKEEAIVILDGFKHNPLFNEQHFEAFDMAISALSENKAEKPETCKGCIEPCIMYEPDMRACKKKVREAKNDSRRD